MQFLSVFGNSCHPLLSHSSAAKEDLFVPIYCNLNINSDFRQKLKIHFKNQEDDRNNFYMGSKNLRAHLYYKIVRNGF